MCVCVCVRACMRVCCVVCICVRELVHTVLVERKARYDKFGEEGLKGGVPTADQDYLEGYTFHGDANRVFKEFFGGDNPFAGIYIYIYIYIFI